MSRARRALRIAATPVVVVGIYAWMIRAVYRDAKTMWRRKREGGAQ